MDDGVFDDGLQGQVGILAARTPAGTSIKPALYPVLLAIKLFVDSTSTTDDGPMVAMPTLSLVPVFLIFLFFDRYLIQGISTTEFKG